MSSIVVRPFRRSDREQVTGLVNAHVSAVVPGSSVSVNTVLSQLEREPGEPIVDPWVVERVTLVAELRGSVVAAALLLRYGSTSEVGADYRGVGEIRWLVHARSAPFRPGADESGDVLIRACLAQLERWGVRRKWADGSLPAPGIYGVPEQWPHVRDLYERSGFVHEGKTEIVLLARVEDLPAPEPDALPGLEIRRSVGVNGVRLSACLGSGEAGYIEVETNLAVSGLISRQDGWADIGNLHTVSAADPRRVRLRLLAEAADWLRLARIDRLLHYAWEDEPEEIAWLVRAGFRVLTHTKRGWARSERG
ncbi:GNAT family N-acetyltransferase [Flindersiella endophytica]